MTGFCCASGLGELNRQLAEFLQPTLWLIRPHRLFPTLSCPYCPTIVSEDTPGAVREFLDSVDVVLCAERPMFDTLADQCIDRKKRLVCIPMQEWMPENLAEWPLKVDLFICPTKQCYDDFHDRIPCFHFPWPVDTHRFSFQMRKVCNSFLFINGHGGHKGRKGFSVLQEAKRIWPEMPLKVWSQVKRDWPDGVEFLGEAKDPTELYSRGDVLVAPHSVDGIGMELMEALSCGMPVVATDGSPWNELPLVGRIAATSTRMKIKRTVCWYEPDPESLVEICKGVLGKSIEEESINGREWAESREWRNSVRDLKMTVCFGQE